MKERNELIFAAMEGLILLLNESNLSTRERKAALACALTACGAIARFPPSTQDEISVEIADTIAKGIGLAAGLETLHQILAPKAHGY